MSQVGAPVPSGGNRSRSKYEWEERRLLLRGGVLDGHRWAGIIGVGKRVCCGDQPWSTACVYVVTAETVDDNGQSANIAVPAFTNG